jgi:hypothetical protein
MTPREVEKGAFGFSRPSGLRRSRTVESGKKLYENGRVRPLRWCSMEGLREAVMRLWDPIGVAAEPAAADEYDDYLPQIERRLIAGNVGELAEYLARVRTETIGMPARSDLDEAAAMRLREWYAAR